MCFRVFFTPFVFFSLLAAFLFFLLLLLLFVTFLAEDERALIKTVEKIQEPNDRKKQTFIKNWTSFCADFRKNSQNGKKKKEVMNVTMFPDNIRDKTQRRRKQILSEIPSLEMLR